MEKMKSRTLTHTMRKLRAEATMEPYLAIRNEVEYEAAVERLNALLDEIGDDRSNPQYRLIETLSLHIEAWDRDHDTLPAVSGIDIVRFLMEQHGLTQGDLPEIGSQGVVSEVLSGRRKLNVRQMQALAARFGVSASAFLDE